MSKKFISLLILTTLFHFNLIGEEEASLATNSFTLPVKVSGVENGSTDGSNILINDQKIWELTRVWPGVVTVMDNYKPLEWQGKYWGSTENSHGGQPGIKIEKSTLSLIGRNAWGKSSPGAKLPALIFNCYESGTYSVSANVNYNSWAGNGKGALLLLKASDGKISEVAHHAVTDKKGDFDLSVTDIELKASDKLIFTLRFNSQSATSYTFKNFVVKLGVNEK